MSPLLDSGDRVSDTLVADRLLGEGAFAEVHRVRHTYLGWQAMKLFKRVADIEQINAMLDEARLLSTLGHRHIVRLFDAGTVATPAGLRGFFTMEYVAGGSLERLVAGYRGLVPVSTAVQVVEQIAEGLAVAHEQDPPIVHRDLTPANVLVGYDGAGLRVRISDFGLAKRADPFTMAASAQGTYAFMAPEVLGPDGGYTRAGDVWSVGMIAYYLLTDHLPFDDGPMSSWSTARFRRPLLPPSAFNAEVDAELDQVVLGMLAVGPDQRTATAGDLLVALRDRRARGASRPTAGPPADRPSTRKPDQAIDRGAERLVAEALVLARHPGMLAQAADLLEEAIMAAPRLRERYLPRLTRWRRGVTL